MCHDTNLIHIQTQPDQNLIPTWLKLWYPIELWACSEIGVSTMLRIVTHTNNWDDHIDQSRVSIVDECSYARKEISLC